MKQLDEERAKLDFGDDDEKAMPGSPLLAPIRFARSLHELAFERPVSRQHQRPRREKHPRREQQPIYQSEHDAKQAGCINFQRD